MLVFRRAVGCLKWLEMRGVRKFHSRIDFQIGREIDDDDGDDDDNGVEDVCVNGCAGGVGSLSVVLMVTAMT